MKFIKSNIIGCDVYNHCQIQETETITNKQKNDGNFL